MVGKHAQIIPTLISILDQMIEGVASSDHASASEENETDIQTAKVQWLRWSLT